MATEEEKNAPPIVFTESESAVPLTKGGHRHRIMTFSALKKEPTKSVYSNIFTVGGHEWQVVCYPGGETDEVGEFISLFLGYRGPAERCQATWLLRCVNQIDPASPRERRWAKGDRYNTFSVGRRWGWQRFIKRDQLLDPTKGYCVNDTVIFETEVTVHGSLVTVDRPFGCDSGYHKEIIAKWPIPPPSVACDLLQLYEDQKEIADVEFVFPEDNDRTIHAHSQILSARSPVFARMFGGGYIESVSALSDYRHTEVAGGSMGDSSAPTLGKRHRSGSTSSRKSEAGPSVPPGEDRNPTSTSLTVSPTNGSSQHRKPAGSVKRIKMIDVQFEVFEEFIKFVYSGKTDPALHAPLDEKSLPEDAKEREAVLESNRERTEFVAALMVVANRYEMNRLRLICERTLASGLNINNAALTLTLADTHCADLLKEHTLSFISRNAIEVQKTPGLKSIGIDLMHELFALTASSKSLKRKRHVRAEGESWLDYAKRLKSAEIRRGLAERGLNAQGSKSALTARLAASLSE